MASVHVALGKVAKTAMSEVIPIPKSVPRISHIVDTASASTESTLEAQAGEIWLVTATGGDVLWKTGAVDEDAAEAPNHYLVAGLPYAFAVEVVGEHFHVADAV